MVDQVESASRRLAWRLGLAVRSHGLSGDSAGQGTRDGEKLADHGWRSVGHLAPSFK